MATDLVSLIQTCWTILLYHQKLCCQKSSDCGCLTEHWCAWLQTAPAGGDGAASSAALGTLRRRGAASAAGRVRRARARRPAAAHVNYAAAVTVWCRPAAAVASLAPALATLTPVVSTETRNNVYDEGYQLSAHDSDYLRMALRSARTCSTFCFDSRRGKPVADPSRDFGVRIRQGY